MPHTQVRITLKVAQYLLETCVRLVSHLHGAEYDPTTGRLGEVEENPSLFEQQNPRDLVLIHWFSSASAILRLISGILSYEIENNAINEVYDEFKDGPDLEDPDQGFLL